MTLLNSATIFLLFPIFQCFHIPYEECFAYKLNFAPHGPIWMSRGEETNRTVSISGTYDCNPEQWSFMRKNCSLKLSGYLRMGVGYAGWERIFVSINFASKMFGFYVDGVYQLKHFAIREDSANFFIRISLPSSHNMEKFGAYFYINGDDYYTNLHVNHGPNIKIPDRVKVYTTKLLRVTHIECEKLGSGNTECELEKLEDVKDRHRCISDENIFKYTSMSKSVF